MERSDPGVSTRESMNISPIISKSQNVNVTKTAILLCLVHPYSLVKPNAYFFLKTREKRPWGVLAPFSLASVV